ncbi:hypothetical protein [Lactobacillus porci]|uniref:hypothetical protein n=1 Tax=Lactobacillus porci TaxID=2012477 RepID=UPI003996609A
MERAQKGSGKAIKYVINAFVIIAVCWMSLFNYLGMAIGGNFYLTMPELEEEILASIVYFSWIFGPVYAVFRLTPWYKGRAAQVMTVIAIVVAIPAGFLANYTTGWIAFAFIMPILFAAVLIYDELQREHGKY